MKRMVSLLAVLLVASLLVAAGTQAQSVTSKVTGAVVSVDKKGKTITFKADDVADNITLPAEGTAIDGLDDVKAGDRVELTCRDDDSGKHQAVTAIAKIKPKT